MSFEMEVMFKLRNLLLEGSSVECQSQTAGTDNVFLHLMHRTERKVDLGTAMMQRMTVEELLMENLI